MRYNQNAEETLDRRYKQESGSLSAIGGRRFAVLQDHRCNLDQPRSIPWDWIQPFEAQALSNHCGQTLERLHARGGMSCAEIWCAVKGKPLREMISAVAAVEWLLTWIRTGSCSANNDRTHTQTPPNPS
jgi:hypothetical protein